MGVDKLHFPNEYATLFENHYNMEDNITNTRPKYVAALSVENLS